MGGEEKKDKRMRVAGYHLHIHQMEEKANLKYMESEIGEEDCEKITAMINS